MLRKQDWAKLASAYAGIVFGIYWIPLRALKEAGFAGVWPTVVFILTPLVLLTPVVAWRFRVLTRKKLHFHLAGFSVGLAFALYASAFVYTDIVRTVLLFYVTPIWGFLLARVVIGERITAVRWCSILLAMAGLLSVLGTDAGLPVPRNLGDWMALCSGLVWAIGSLMLLLDKESHPADYALGFFFWGALCAGGFAWLISAQALTPYPDWSALGTVWHWLIPVSLLVTLPAGFAVVFGPSELNPGVAGLLFMTEIIVATITAALLAGEPFGLPEAAGVVLICAAGLLEPLAELRRPIANSKV